MTITLHLAGTRKLTETLRGVLSLGNLKTCLQQGLTHSNKATPFNNATPYEIMGANYTQTATDRICSPLLGVYVLCVFTCMHVHLHEYTGN